jgi:hypothetical protein
MRFSFQSLWKQFVLWCRLQKLEHEFRSSERFQKVCEEIQCFILAELEETHRTKIAEEIRRLKGFRQAVYPMFDHPASRHEEEFATG